LCTTILIIIFLFFCGFQYRVDVTPRDNEDEKHGEPIEKKAIISKRNAKQFSCNTPDECFKLHTSSLGLASALKDRCSIGNKTNLHERNLTFTHIPKCGGSSLRYLLNKHFKSRFQRFRIGTNMGPHVPFFLSQKQFPRNIFFTVLREPSALAISLYNYVNMRKSLPQHLTHDKFWKYTFGRDPVEWSMDKFIRKTLQNQVLRFFRWHSRTGADGTGVLRQDFSNPHMWRAFLSLPETYNRVLDPWVHLDLPEGEGLERGEQMMNQSLFMPEKYRCSSELRAVSILIQRYSAVGVIEKYEQFFHVLHHRARLDDEAFHAMMTDSSEIKNPSQNKISKTNEKLVRGNLHDLFFCSRMLWKVASLISDHDSSCYIQ
jgi:hypothetical protein